MNLQTSRFDYGDPAQLFSIGCCMVLLSLWLPFIPDLPTFIHIWRVELFASVFLSVSLAYLFYRQKDKKFLFSASRDEFKFIVFPILAFIAWSLISIVWAASWKSALHHALVWSEYLIFYLIVREIIQHKVNRVKMLTMLGFTLVLFSIPAVIEYCAFLVFGGGTSLGIRYAKYGEQVNTLLPLMLVGVLRLKGKRFLAGLSAAALLWLLIFCSFGRINVILFLGGAAAVTVAVFIFPVFRNYRIRMAAVIAVLILAPLPLHLFSLLSTATSVTVIERLGGGEAIAESNNFRRMMTAISLEMIKAHPLTGVGADNYGTEVNKYRAVYGAQNGNDPNLAVAENEIPERAHNEFLQIAAELGFVGGLIFLWFLSSIGIMVFRAVRSRQRSPVPAAALLGVLMFLASSIVSSYSFRLIQNGFVFFFVLAVASKYLLKTRKQPEPAAVSPGRMKAAYSIGIAACLLLAVYSITRVASVYFNSKAGSSANLDEARPFLITAIRLDAENPNPHNIFGMALLHERRFVEAVPYLEKSVELGRATSADLSYLATAQILSNNNAAAEGTFAYAALLYPQSPFVLTRYAAILQANGKSAESAAELKRARTIDNNAANTWWTMMHEGPRAATDIAMSGGDHTQILDLTPQAAVYAIVKERELKNPNEKIKMNFEQDK